MTEWIMKRWRSSITRRSRSKKKKSIAQPIISERMRARESRGNLFLLAGQGQRPCGAVGQSPTSEPQRASKTHPDFLPRVRRMQTEARRAERAHQAAAQQPLAANCADYREAVRKERSTRTRKQAQPRESARGQANTDEAVIPNPDARFQLIQIIKNR